MDSAWGSQSSEAMPLAGISGPLGTAALHHMKEELERGLAQLWEVQLQEFLKTVEVPQTGCGVPQLPEESTPWDDAKAFLASFEQVAKACQWPKEEWAARLQPALGGEAKHTFLRMDAGDRGDYGKVKSAILQGDAMNREKIRQHFRQFCYQEAEGPRGTYSQLQELCHGWLKVEKHSKEQILELLVLEQFLTVLPGEMQNFVRRNCPETCTQAVTLAEDFLLGQLESEAWIQQMAEPLAEPLTENVQQPELIPLFTVQDQSQPSTEVTWEQHPPPLDHGKLRGNQEEHPQEIIKRAEPQGIAPEQANDHSLRCNKNGEILENQHILERKQVTHPVEGGNKPVPCKQDDRKSNVAAPQQGLSKGTRGNTCAVCGKSFRRNFLLVSHKRTHTGERPYRCSHCGKSFICSQYLRKHQKIHTGKKPHKCVKCEKAFYERSSLRRHQRFHTREKPYQCPDCGESFVWSNSLAVHRKIHVEGKTSVILPCEKQQGKGMICICCECGESFSNTSDLDSHQCGFSAKKGFCCLVCGKRFCDKARLKRHQPLHTGEKPYKCPDCGERFMWSSSFSRHRKIHIGAKRASQSPCRQGENYRCSKCGEILSAQEWNRHQCINSADPLRPYKCPECGEVFRWKSSLERHRKNHKREKLTPVLQNTTNASMVYLRRISASEQPHKCLKCGKSFYDKSRLKRHQLVHTKEKPYKCTECGQSFRWKSSLKVHAKNHATKRFHTCPECGKTFQRPSHVVKHQKCHTKESAETLTE
ncbi:zinc finger protein 397-like [Heteronotia binoei]|uniref:zinc finger protein 397-like n=1 Tax=Heteronotia binoei TaxID=13085 RepID=UPI00293081AF|nr:zinc finger protein 397-like [Heteronotia binoei]